jgi:hypothetical protein
MFTGKLNCFFPWDTIEQVSAFRLPILAGRGPICTAMRMTSVEHLGASPRARQQFERAKALLGWHLLVLPCTYTLSTAQLVLLLQTYLYDAEERAKIGTAAELAQVKTALQITGG